MKMLSLFDYLGHPAGSELGQLVYKIALLNKVPTSCKPVKNKNYDGWIMMYSKEFLDNFFKSYEIFYNYFSSPYTDFSGINSELIEDYERKMAGELDLPF